MLFWLGISEYFCLVVEVWGHNKYYELRMKIEKQEELSLVVLLLADSPGRPDLNLFLPCQSFLLMTVILSNSSLHAVDFGTVAAEHVASAAELHDKFNYSVT